jgi:hypothetical protein
MESSEITVELKEVPTFIKKKHELDKLLKTLQTNSQAAVMLLANTMNNEEVDLKIRVECAKNLVEFTKSVSHQINADEMARLVAEVRFGDGPTKKLGMVTTSSKPTPILNFEDIREV